jgi:hypothetical protein
VVTGAVSPIGLRHYARYAVFCVEVWNCIPMREELHGRLFLDTSHDFGGTATVWLERGRYADRFLKACEDEPAPIDLADLN